MSALLESDVSALLESDVSALLESDVSALLESDVSASRSFCCQAWPAPANSRPELDVPSRDILALLAD